MLQTANYPGEFRLLQIVLLHFKISSCTQCLPRALCG